MAAAAATASLEPAARFPLLCALLAFFLPAAAAAAAVSDAVLDTDGHAVVAGAYYNITVAGSIYGLVTTLHRDHLLCPFDVAVTTPGDDVGYLSRPTRFYPGTYSRGTLRLGVDANVEFEPGVDICMVPYLWGLLELPDVFVTLNGRRPMGIDPDWSNHSLFRVEKADPAGKTYKFRFCPAVCKECQDFCGDLGFVFAEGNTRLAIVKDSPAAAFVFKKTAPIPTAEDARL